MAHIREKKLPPIHPGEVLQDVLNEAGIVAKRSWLWRCVFPRTGLEASLKAQRGITGDTALRLARYFGTSAQMWMNLQSKCDLEMR